MSSNLNPALKARNAAFFNRSAAFRRKSGSVRTKKIQRKFHVRLRHILMSFLLLTAIFYSAHKLYVFLISWDELSIRRVGLSCREPQIREQVFELLRGRVYGNLLLFDSSGLRDQLITVRGVKDVRIKKTIPPALTVEITERVPAAVIKREGYHLIDADGVILEPASPDSRQELPLLYDRSDFSVHYEEKLTLAWSCLESFEPQTRARLAILDLTNPFNLQIRFKDSPVWLKLGRDRFAEKYRDYRRSAALWKSLGPLEYVDLRFEDRFYVKKGTPDTLQSVQNKEAH